MRIMLFITGLGIGGAERQVADLADEFVSRGHDVIIIALTGNTIVQPVSKKIQVVLLGMHKTPAGFISAYMRARKLIHDFSPDIVHSHMVHANLFARLLRITVPIPRLICTAHSTNEGGKLRMLAYRLTDRLADMSTNVSQNAVDTFVKQHAVSAEKMFAMHNGIDTSKFRFNAENRQRIRSELGIDTNVQVLLAVGRLALAKDYPNLLRAFALLHSQSVNCVLWIVGAGSLEIELRSLAESLGVIDKIHFWGLSHDIPRVMSGADILVLSSAWEGFGLVVAEAMACQRLVVATDAGGVREVIGDVGWLVPIRDSEKLANAIKAATTIDASERLARGLAGRARIKERYSLTAIAARWLNIYQGRYDA
ncbi:MAG: glycosyltransferase [Glaciimonas sp.]|nr:glycosyltransferase [Glaciimonas sp.]